MIKNIIYKKPLFFAAFIIIIIGAFGIYSKFEQKNSYNNSITVDATVIEQSHDCESLNHKSSYIKLKYEQKIYVKKIGVSYCKNLGKSQIKVKFDKKTGEIYFIGETFEDDMAFSFLILLIGVIIAFKGWKKQVL